jgi:dTDP-4-dehydrorhamnose reductase
MNILVTGSNGQLGNEVRVLSSLYPDTHFLFTDVAELDICNKKALSDFIEINTVQAIINCAAYTAVDKAEDDVELCYQINRDAVRNIAELAALYQLKVVHVSTDYVFDGTSYIPLTEDQATAALGVYGKSKLAGEQELMLACPNAVIVRTSWLYSSYGANFVKTMIKLGTERDSLNVIFDQVGTPTYAADLALAILNILHADQFVPGIYHYSNEGVCSWYDFTKRIHKLAGVSCDVKPIETKDYPTRTPRPHYSVLNKSKIKSTYKLEIPYWEDSLEICIGLLQK